MSRRRSKAVATAFAVVLTLAGAGLHGSAAATARTTPSVSGTDASSGSDRALAQARTSGERVEVPGERTAYETVFANPNGTFTLEKSVVPVRAKAQDGQWTAPSDLLVRRQDGSIGPEAAAVDLEFSAGGRGGELVSIASGGRSITLGWPGNLPAPRLDGNRAVYENVLPDVNLILTATTQGFRQVLEVKTPEAATHDALKSIEFALKATGLTVKEGGGGVTARDGHGQVVFRSPAAQMWNSAGTGGTTAEATAVRRTAPAEASGTQELTPAGPPQEGDPLAGPGPGDESAVMDLDVDADSVTVKPDANLIAGTDAADYPLYIDPSVEMNESERTVLSSDGDVFYDFSGGVNGMSVGKCGQATIGGSFYYCGSGYVNRMYFEFAPDKLRGKQVLDATFRVTETWSFSCDPRWVNLERTNNISPSSRWPGPAEIDHIGDRFVSAGRGDACSPSQPRAPIDFNDNPEEQSENLTPTVRSFAEGKFSRLTLMLRAADESDPIAWKRFDDDAVLTVSYVSKPAVPKDFGLATGSGWSCVDRESMATVVTDPKPKLVARPQTMSGGEAEGRLRIYFDLDVKNADGTWSDAAEPPTGSLVPASGYAYYNATSKSFPQQGMLWSPSLTDGKMYRFHAATYSYDTNGNSYSSASTSSAKWCYFRVDSLAPKAPNVSFSAVYTECVTGGPCAPGGGPGVEGRFNFGPSTNEVNTGYQYKLSTSNEWSDWIGGFIVPAVRITPPISGTVALEVRARSAGYPNGGAIKSVRFLVDQGSMPILRWSFDEPNHEGADTTKALDRSPTEDSPFRDTATLVGAERTDHGRRGEIQIPATESTPEHPAPDHALRLSGTGHAATAQAVLETASSFTVATWTRLEETGRNQTVLGQDGTQQSAFLLSYCHDVLTWCVRLPDSDTANSAFSNQRVNARNPAVKGVWTHLAAVVDRAANQLTLYVNGQAQGTDTISTNWSGSGALQVGRVKYKGSYTDYFTGEVDEVAAWQTVKQPQEMANEARLLVAPDEEEAESGLPQVELVTHWDAADAVGADLADVSGYGNTLSMGTGAALDGESIVLSGAGGLETNQPPIDTTGSFTVATHVDLDTDALAQSPDGHSVQVTGQRTATGSSWGIWFTKTGVVTEPVLDDDGNPMPDPENPGDFLYTDRLVGAWHFGRLASSGAAVLSVSSSPTTVEDGPMRVVGVFDAQDPTHPGTGAIRLYLADAEGDAKEYTGQATASGLSLGQGWTDGAWGHNMPGRIADLRLWAGAMADAHHITTLVGA
ncbi:LamG domain-containing protein [Streptomyces zhihengii]